MAEHLSRVESEVDPGTLSPMVAIWELSSRLRARRRTLQLDVATITQQLDCSRPYWSRVENNRTVLAETKLEAVLDLMEFDETERIAMRSLRAAARQRSWWSGYNDLVPEFVLQIYGLEAGARSIRAYEANLVNGLIQTKDYARQLISSHAGNRLADVNRLVEIRMQRQLLLSAPDGPRIDLVMSESVLWQRLGSVAIQQGQLQHLLDVIEQDSDRVTIRVLPFEASPGPAAGASTFFLLDFESPNLATVGWQEAMFGSGFTEKVKEVDFLVTCYDEVAERSLSLAASAELVASVLARLELAPSGGRELP